MKARVTNSDFRYKSKIIKEGETEDFPKEEIESHPDILIPVTDETKTATKSKKKSK